MARLSSEYDSVKKIRINRKIYTRVSEEKYRLAERIRNYVLRTNYETGEDKVFLSIRAVKLFTVGIDVVEEAIKEYPKWFYGNGIVHKPIEDFIAADKQKQKQTQPKIHIVVR